MGRPDDGPTWVVTLRWVSVCLDVQVYQGLLERDTALVVNVSGGQGDTVDVLVENMGRVNFGNNINDHKVTKKRPRLSRSSDCACGVSGSLAIAH